MSPLLLLFVFLPFTSTTVTPEDHKGKRPRLHLLLGPQGEAELVSMETWQL